MPGFFSSVSILARRPFVSIFLFGVASGFPWVMIGSVMTAWLKDAGLTRAAIGYFTAVFAVYSINFLWSPLVDRVKLPLLQPLLGQRRSWILLTQLLLVAGCLALSQIDVTRSLTLAGVIALAIACASATQDIAVDAFRIDSIPADHNERQGTGAAMATSGWWTGFSGLGAIPFFVVETPGWDWSDIYVLLAIIMACLAVLGLFAREPQSNRERFFEATQARYLPAVVHGEGKAMLVLLGLLLAIVLLIFAIFLPSWFEYQRLSLGLATGLCLLLAMHSANRLLDNPNDGEVRANAAQRTVTWLLVSVGEPLRDFFSRNGIRLAWSILLFILLFKLGEAFLGRMSIVFYKEIGFSNADIGTYSKLLNWAVTVVASVISGLVTVRIGLFKGLLIGGGVMAASNLLFALLALVGPNKPLLVGTIIVDGFTAAWGTVVFMAFISSLCNRAFTASQYALLVSIGTLGRTTLGAFSGAMVDYLNGNWALFFVLTTVMVIPSLLLLISMRDWLNKLQAGPSG